MQIAALYVHSQGPYMNRPDIDAWDIKRDAKCYPGSDPVIAHPPCKRWGRYWHGGPSAKERMVMGDDDGCFEHALAMVRQYGGVLEHPEASGAWDHFGLMRPPKDGGWVSSGMFDGGWTCCVEQGHYGHKARKATWLYVYGAHDLPELKWGKSEAYAKLDDEFRSAAERAASKHWDPKWKRFRYKGPWDRISKKEREITPDAFVDVLIDLASRVR